jgi:hypothetical protein
MPPAPVDPESARRRWDLAIGLGVAAFLLAYAYRPVRLGDAVGLDWWWVLAAVGLVAIARQVRHPRPSLWATASAPLSRRLRAPGAGLVVVIALVSRLAVLGAGLAAVTHDGMASQDPPRATSDEFWNLPARWDAFWYLSIANDGYSWNPSVPADQANVAFFPAFPIAMRVAGSVVTMPAYWLHDGALFGGSGVTRLLFGGTLLSIGAFVWALLLIEQDLAGPLLGARRARWAVLLLASFPFSLFYSAPYTEGLFLLAVVEAFVAIRRGQTAAAALWGALASLTRQTGVLVAIPLALLAWTEGRSALRRGEVRPGARPSPPVRNAALVAIGPALGLAVHLGWLWHLFGDPLVFVKVQAGWRSSTESLPFVFERLRGLSAVGLARYVHDLPGYTLGTFVPLLALALLWRTWRLGPAYAALVLVTFGPAVLVDTPSIGRIGSTMFPMFMALAAVLPNRRTAWTVAVLFGLGQLWAATVFFRWGMLY